MTTLNHIEGVLTLTAPLHCSSGAKSTGATGKNATGTMQQPLISSRGRAMVPYFPANDLRGRLRRKAAKILVDQLTSGEGRLSVELLAGLTCGAISASGENDVSIEEVLRARSNVYMGLFGGGTRLMRSGMQVHDLIPFVADTVETGLVPDYLGVEIPMSVNGGGSDAAGNPVPAPLRPWQLLHSFQTVRVDDVYRVLNVSLAEAALTDAATEVTRYQKSVLEGRMDRKASKEAGGEVEKKKDVGNIMEAEAIAAGTKMHIRIDMDDHLSDAQRGLLLLALRDLCNEQALGGMVRHGWGRFTADLRGKFDGNNVDDSGAPLPILVFNKDLGLYQLTGMAASYAENAMAEIGALSIEDMWAFFKPMKEAA